MLGRLKDFQRIATRYDRSTINFMAAILIVATVAYGLWVRTLSYRLDSWRKIWKCGKKPTGGGPMGLER